MSDYEAFEGGAESELGNLEAYNEEHGWDAMTQTQAGMRQDEFLKDSGMTIDTVGDAKKVEEKREKKERNSESGIAAAFEGARHHIDKHEYEFKLDGADYKITHGELKKFMQDKAKDLKKKLKNTTDAQERAQLARDIQKIEEINETLKTGHMTAEQQEWLQNDWFVRHPEDKEEFINRASKTENALQNEDHQELIRQQREAFEDNENHTVGNEFNPQSRPEPIQTTVSNDIGNDFGDIMVAQSNHETPEVKPIDNSMVSNKTMNNDFAMG